MHSQIGILNSLGARVASKETLQRCMDRKYISLCLIPLFECFDQTPGRQKKKKEKQGKKKKLKTKQRQQKKQRKH